MIKISIADNQPVVSHGLKCFFKKNSYIKVVDSINCLEEVEVALKNKMPDILIIDIQLEGLHTIKVLKRFIDDNPSTKLLIYTCASEKIFGVPALKIGVHGYISKNESLKNVEDAIMEIAGGKILFSEYVQKAAVVVAGLNKGNRLYRKLSTRETEVLQFLIDGKKNNEISDLLNLNEKTISTYKLRLLNKLNVTNVMDLVNKAKTLEIC